MLRFPEAVPNAAVKLSVASALWGGVSARAGGMPRQLGLFRAVGHVAHLETSNPVPDGHRGLPDGAGASALAATVIVANRSTDTSPRYVGKMKVDFYRHKVCNHMIISRKARIW